MSNRCDKVKTFSVSTRIVAASRGCRDRGEARVEHGKADVGFWPWLTLPPRRWVSDFWYAADTDPIEFTRTPFRHEEFQLRVQRRSGRIFVGKVLDFARKSVAS